MSIKRGGGNISLSQRVYEKDYILEFHKGFVLTRDQHKEVKAYLDSHDFGAVETFLKEHFPSEVPIVQGLLENQKKLKREGYYDAT